MPIILIKRGLAFLTDFVLIAVYALLLLIVSLLAQKATHTNFLVLTPLTGQIIGFTTLTLPVFLYFFFSEKSSKKATIGKRINKIQVDSAIKNTVTARQIFIRNLLKFLPWEIAHTGVYWLIYYSKNQAEVPAWVFALLIIPQLIVIVYWVTIIASKGKSSLYDKISNTKIVSY